YMRLPNGIKRPIIRIAVEHKGRLVPYFGLIDSGADINLFHNLFHAEIAELLGLNLEGGERRTVAGVVEGERRRLLPSQGKPQNWRLDAPQCYSRLHALSLKERATAFSVKTAFSTSTRSNSICRRARSSYRSTLPPPIDEFGGR